MRTEQADTNTSRNSMQASIPPLALVSRNISAQIADHLENLIMTGTLVPGTRLPTERSLAEEFKVSRTSVREALSELESKHLIERVQDAVVPFWTPCRTLGNWPRCWRPQTWSFRMPRNARIGRTSHRRLGSRTSLTNSCCGLGKYSRKSRRISQSRKIDETRHPIPLLLAHATGNKLLLTVLQFAFKCTEHVRERSHQTATGNGSLIWDTS